MPGQNPKPRPIGLVAFGLGVIAGGKIASTSYRRFRRLMVTAATRLRAGSQVVATSAGVVEFAEQGSGAPVLVVHGAGGGYDQGLALGLALLGTDFHQIAPSRFGYLRSPILEDGSTAAQADVFAALLDCLEVERTAVVAVSDGGPSALMMAIRHPERIAALVLISAKSTTPPPESPFQRLVFSLIFRSDYLYWIITERFQPFLLSMLGVPRKIRTNLSREQQRLLSEFVRTMHPMSIRKEGIYHDRRHLANLRPADFPLSQIAAPTLIIHAEDDSLQPFLHAEYAAAHIPNARLISHAAGGHILVGQLAETRETLATFLGAHVES